MLSSIVNNGLPNKQLIFKQVHLSKPNFDARSLKYMDQPFTCNTKVRYFFKTSLIG